MVVVKDDYTRLSFHSIFFRDVRVSNYWELDVFFGGGAVGRNDENLGVH